MLVSKDIVRAKFRSVAAAAAVLRCINTYILFVPGQKDPPTHKRGLSNDQRKTVPNKTEQISAVNYLSTLSCFIGS